MVVHLFPFGKVKQGSKIVIYGAGDVGLDFYCQIKATDYCEIALWVDKNYKHYQERQLPVENPEEIANIKYDTVIIAIANLSIVPGIKEYLFELGVAEKDIVWGISFPRNHTPDSYISNEFDKANIFHEKIECMVAKDILTSERLDIIVRYLFALDIKNHIDSDRHRKLYSRFILTGIGAEEPMVSANRMKALADYDEKIGVDAFISSFENLVESMRKGGFAKEKYIPLNKHGEILNGSHRLATALALEEKVWVKYLQEDRISGIWNLKRFQKEGFSNEDCIDILRGFSDLYPSCNMLVMFGGVQGLWDFIEHRVIGNHKIVGSIILDFESDYIAYENIIREIYYDKSNIADITKYLLLNKLTFKIVVFSDENGDQDLFSESNKVAKDIIKMMQLDRYDIYVGMNILDFNHLKKVLLSNNNLEKMSMIIRNVKESDYIARLDNLRECIEEQGYSLDDVCLLDESIMQIFGLRETDKIEVAAVKGCVEHIKLPKGCILIRRYPDSYLNDNNFHFIFRGFKIINPEISIARKLDRINALTIRDEKVENDNMNYRKERRDYRLLQLLFDYVGNFDNKRALKDRFDFEIRRQWAKNSYFENYYAGNSDG